MSTVVEKIILFTVTACPTGRSKGQVLAELEQLHSQLVTETLYAEIHTEETNHFRIKINPTLLFLSKEGNELFRIEGFIETKEIQQQLALLQQGMLQLQSNVGENVSTLEKYTIHLLQQNRLVPLEVEYHNPTGVKAPRITAIRLQLETRVAELENPFPAGTTLELVQFAGPAGKIYLRVNPPHDANQEQQMKEVLLKTLQPYDVQDIEVYVD